MWTEWPVRRNQLIGRKGFKLVILDEADMMTQAAQGALRRGESETPLLIINFIVSIVIIKWTMGSLDSV
jgi:DNA polymerase III delta prime subunit